MADEKKKVLENIAENVIENTAENDTEKGAEIRTEELEEVAGGIIPPWPHSPTK